MSQSHGTGQPLHFFCTACRRRPAWHSLGSRRPGRDVVRTGRKRPYRGGNGGRRVLHEHHEYICLTCGHVGWSRHHDMLSKPLQADVQAGIQRPSK